MNKVILCGRLTKDPEVRYSSGDKQTAIARYNLAVDRRFKSQGEEQTAENTTQENGQTEAAAEGDDIQVQTNTEQTETQPQTDTGAVQTAGQTDNAQAQETAVVQPEASQYLSQGYYIVQKGDSLVGICRKVYNTTAMMDKLCETNGIDNPDAIYEGQYLTLPN